METGEGPRPAVVDALRRLGVENLVLGVLDASFPSDPTDDTGRGTPCSPAGAMLAASVRRLGFNGLQLGPQGLTAIDDPSPYAGTLFSRDPLSISLARLADPEGEWQGLLPPERLAALVEERPRGALDRVPYEHVHRAHHGALAEAWQRFETRLDAGESGARKLATRLDSFRRENAAWLEPDAVYEVLRNAYGQRDFPSWTGPQAELDRALGRDFDSGGRFAARRRDLDRRSGDALRLYRFVQLVAHAQHAAFREESDRIGLRLYGDLQVGVSPREAWRHPEIFLPGYRLGAPPSRTNPDGQPWHYPVLDPDAYHDAGGPGAAMRFLSLRIEKAFAEFDALRIDHPQGLVCPWVYREDDPDVQRAVQQGARLFSSPDLPDHPRLARYAIPEADQLASDPGVPRYADDHVRSLRPDQVDRYAILMDRVVEAARRSGAPRLPLVCEVLSTLPHPLARVLERHDLGRFRVTQKAKLDDPRDVYRAENALAHDWVMFGNHDTPPVWQLLGRWKAEGRLAARARHAARILARGPGDERELAAELETRPDRLAHAEIALLFASPAENVLIYFSDLFGLETSINRPGTTDAGNWRTRLPRDWWRRYGEAVRDGRAIDLGVALAMALRARGGDPDLLRALDPGS